MRTALRRVAAGALAYVVSYVLIGLVTVPRLGQYLAHDSGDAVLDAYHAAGSPLWQAIGWFTLNAHGVPIDVAAVRGTGNFVSDGAWLGVIPGWLGLVPMVACLLVGVAVTATNRSSPPVPASVGTYMLLGYLFALLLSTVAFAGAVGPVAASAGVSMVLKAHPGGRWLLLVIFSTLVFGSLGAWLGRSPVVTATIERLWSGPSRR